MWSAALIFSNKNHGLQKKKILHRKNIKKFLNYMFDTHDVTSNLRRWNNESIDIYKNEILNARFTKSSYKIELWKMTSHFELLSQKFLYRFFYGVTNSTSWKIKLNFELLTRRFNFYFSTFELPTQRWKTKSCTLSQKIRNTNGLSIISNILFDAASNPTIISVSVWSY